MTEFTEPLSEYGDLMTVEDFLGSVEDGMFVDYDGHGVAVGLGIHKGVLCLLEANVIVKPSKVKAIPEDATHVLWFNK